ncbi:MAG: NeuD/PglB/VioB family sugar acetyltransferase [Synergistaceae bacterium]|nr:NeuD/PglB/VioB family sugar acetyltransferase [Synergistaceae bacterium]
MILGIYGSGGLGREMLELARIINNNNLRWENIIFIDDADKDGSLINGAEVYKYDEALNKFKNLEITIGIGEPIIREKLFNKIKVDNIKAAALIHPGVHIPETTKIGEGATICMNDFISCNVVIGDNVYIQPSANIGHDSVLDEGAFISAFCNIAGAVHVGKYTYIGMSAAVKELINIGSYSIIGMYSAVYKDIPDEVVAVGNPARPMKRNEEHRVFKH